MKNQIRYETMRKSGKKTGEKGKIKTKWEKWKNEKLREKMKEMKK